MTPRAGQEGGACARFITDPASRFCLECGYLPSDHRRRPVPQAVQPIIPHPLSRRDQGKGMSEKVSDARLDELIAEHQHSIDTVGDMMAAEGLRYCGDIVDALRELRELRAVAERAKFGEREG